MKKSITYLPPANRKDLKFLVEMLLERLKETEMIILFGSYARNDYVVYDEKYEFGKNQFYVSDYDLLVVTSRIKNGTAGKTIDNVEDLYYDKAKDPDRQVPVQFINDDIKKLNKDLEEGRYFYCQIKKEGIMLYDSGKYKLARRRKLKFHEIQQQAQEYFDEKFKKANSFLRSAKHDYDDIDYQMASFHLHQACENYYYSMRLVYTQENNKQHNLTKLSGSVRKYSEDLVNVFPRNTVEEKRLFNLIKAAYVEGRYNPDFQVTKEDIDVLMKKVELLRDITGKVCKNRIKEYGEKK